MKRKIIIYGAGKLGKKALFCLKDDYEIMFFVDSDQKKWGTNIENYKVNSPEILKDYLDVCLVIACSKYSEILNCIKSINMKDILLFQFDLERTLPVTITEQLDKRTINLGHFFGTENSMTCKELTFLPGGSGILDYFFLKQLAIKFDCKSYMEIGTYIGESINILTDTCEELYSLTAPLDAPYSMRSWCKTHRMPDYSDRLTYNNKIKHFYFDSKTFDFSMIPHNINLFFIDGDHSYEGVYSDTMNVFKIKNENAIVVWHDFKKLRNAYNAEVIQAVKDALGNDFSNVYVTDNNICGVYLPNSIKDSIVLCGDNSYDINCPLYVYNTNLVTELK